MSITSLRRAVFQLTAKADGCKQRAELIVCADARELEGRLEECGEQLKIFVIQLDRFAPSKTLRQKPNRTKEQHMSALSLG
jgi:hypothetical protein